MAVHVVDPVAAELARLKAMSSAQLRQRHFELFAYPSHSGNRQFLIKRVAWRWQAMREPNFEERIKRLRERALEIANDADLRIRPTRTGTLSDMVPERTVVGSITPRTEGRLPAAGTILTRYYKGRKLEVMVQQDGFDFEGRRFKSLSAVAKHISGSHCNGFHFFRIGVAKDGRGKP